MLKYLAKFLYVIQAKPRNLAFLLSTFVFASLLEAVGIGIIGPFIRLATTPSLIANISWLNQIYIQTGLNSESKFLAFLGLVAALIYCTKSIIYFIVKAHIVKFSFKQKSKLVYKLLTSYLSVPYSFHLHKNSATFIKNIVVETQKFTYGGILPVLNITANSIIVLALIFVLTRVSGFFMSAILAVTIPIFGIFYLLRGRIKLLGKKSSLANQEMIKIINHSLGSIKETKIIGCELYFQQKMEVQANIFSDVAALFQAMQFLPRVSLEAVVVVFILVFISVSLFIDGKNAQDFLSILSVFSVASIRLIPAISQIIYDINMIQNNTYSLDLLYLDLKELESQDKLKKHLPNLPLPKQSNMPFVAIQGSAFKEVELKNIYYQYRGSKEPSLKNISLNIRRGESVAFIGKSGAGKTTLVDVLLGLLSPSQGDILVDGQSIYQTLEFWRSLVGYIPQSIFLMDDSVKRNIAFGVPDELIDLAKLNQAIQLAQLSELVQQLPDGLETLVGEKGTRLSGGQRQRIGIARALYHNREILVLDEATAALDGETEKLITSSIESLAGDKTLIIIAHRLSTIRNCDRVVVLDNGHIAKIGSYQEIVESQVGTTVS